MAVKSLQRSSQVQINPSVDVICIQNQSLTNWSRQEVSVRLGGSANAMQGNKAPTVPHLLHGRKQVLN